MALEPGRRLGPYEIVSQIGAGGMGEVYKATDTRLDRTIAIKVLPEHLSTDAQRLARFQREAQAISRLNHPHICALHDVGDDHGTHFLVMEYVQGEALDQRLERGPIPLAHALEYAKQIADALEKAHHQGIVHRDLKPANVMIAPSGVKLLDFGLARLSAEPESSSPLSQMKTQESDLTAEGSIMGTFRYMAPEQVEGQQVDARTDVYALCLLIYEMVTGQRAIDGKSQASLIAAILKDKPRPLTELQPITPPQLDRIVQTGLEKDPDRRWQSARELRHALDWIGMETPAGAAKAAGSEPDGRLWKAIAAVAVLAAVLVTWALWPTPAPPEMRVDITTPATIDAASFALSPTGDSIVFVADDDDQPKLWLRTFGSGGDEARVLDGTDGAALPFWSPDGESVGFFAGRQLKTVRLDGGVPQVLAPIVFAGGGTWADGVIVFSPGGGNTIFQISETGGESGPVVANPAVFNGRPQFLPDRRRFLFWNAGAGADPQGIYIGSLDSEDSRFLLASEAPGAFHPAGYVLYLRQGTLWAQGFDPDSEALRDDARRVADGVVSVSVSESGAVAYRRGGTVGTELRWFDREGEPQDILADDFETPVISRDGTLVAAIRGGDVWVMAPDLASPRRVTFDGRRDTAPVLSPDGSQVAFAAFRDVVEIHQVTSTGAGTEIVLLPDGGMPSEWLPDGSGILYSDVSGSNVDLRVAHFESAGEVTDYLADPQNAETRGQVSPNGRWIAYELETAGRREIFVRPFPDASSGGLWQVATDGSQYVRWSRDGTELYYLAPTGVLTAVPVDTTGSVFQFGTAEPLFQTRIALDSVTTLYDVSPNGDFLMTVPGSDGTNSPIHLIFNWNPDTE